MYAAIREVLPKYGLSVAQTMLPRDDGKAHVRTMLMHSSGQWLAGECVMSCQQQGPQGMGSAITYARRYSLSAMVGVVSEDDDDAEGATNRSRQATASSPARASAAKPKATSQGYNMTQVASEIAAKSTIEELKAYFSALGIPDNHPQREAVRNLVIQATERLKAHSTGQTAPRQDGITQAQLKSLQSHYSRLGYDRDQRLAHMSKLVGRPVDSASSLSKAEASRLIDDFLRQTSAEYPADYPF